jgi:2-methylcitrate dehydratase PrpD
VLRNNGAVEPLDTMGAQYSIPYCAALALTADPDDFSMYEGDALNDPSRRELARRVELTVDPQVEALYPQRSSVSMEIRLAGGDTRSVFISDPRGAADNPCTSDELTEKFSRLAGRVMRPDAVRSLARAIYSTDTLASTRELTARLRGLDAAEV